MDIIIFSAVRSNEKGAIGFLADQRRLNVAITRARFALWMLGNASTLKTNATWRNLITHAKNTGFASTHGTLYNSLRKQFQCSATVCLYFHPSYTYCVIYIEVRLAVDHGV